MKEVYDLITDYKQAVLKNNKDREKSIESFNDLFATYLSLRSVLNDNISDTQLIFFYREGEFIRARTSYDYMYFEVFKNITHKRQIFKAQEFSTESLGMLTSFCRKTGRVESTALSNFLNKEENLDRFQKIIDKISSEIIPMCSKLSEKIEKEKQKTVSVVFNEEVKDRIAGIREVLNI